MQHQGSTGVEGLLNSLPQANSGLTLGANGPSVAPLTGTATADLRGIGAFRTLVLINGKRPAPGDPINPSADLNTIPSVLVKRVEVLTGGASAVYGSDAVAGVVNFILDDRFTGFKVSVEGGINRASNDQATLQSIALTSGVTPATGTVYDGRTLDVSLVYGSDFQAGHGHVTAYGGYRHMQEVRAGSRDFGACTLIETGTSYACLLDGTTPSGQFVPNGGAGTPLTLDTTNGHAFRNFNSATDSFNPVPFQDLQRPDTRYNAGVFLTYGFSEAVRLYAEAQLMDDRTTVHYEPAGTTPTGAGLNVYGVNCNNPLLSVSQVNDLCTSQGLGPLDTAQVAIGRSNTEGGQRADEFHHQSYRFVAGLKGEISEPWSYDVSLMHGRVNGRERLTNDLSNSRLANALNVVSAGGVPVCQSVVDGSDPACIPYNIYSTGGVTAAALAYIRASGRQSGYAQRTVLTGQLVGELEGYGVKSPLAVAGASVALGAEYRTESVAYTQDEAYSSGDLLVTGGATPTVGSYHVSEVFSEFKLPLVENRAFANRLVLTLSDRYARYDPQGGVNAYGVGLEWAPVTSVHLRASVSRAVRAPNALELFSAQVLGQTSLTDPCAGSPTSTAAECARTGVSATQYGTIAPQSTINVVTGGNLQLKPETADTVTTGLVFTPRSNVLLSADYWRIKVKQYVGGLPASYTLNTCLNSGDPVYCSLIHRDANGSLSTGNGAGAGRIVSTRFNTGSYGTSGLDFEGRYALDLAAYAPLAGTLSFSFTGSLSIDNPIDVTPGGTPFDCTGYYGVNCSGGGPTSPVPRWRHRLRTTWEGAHGFQVSVNWRHIGSLQSELTSNNGNLNGTAFPVDSTVPAYEYFDIDGGANIGSHLNVRLGISNIADRKPPVAGFNANPQLVNGNMVAGMYDILGRFMFMGLSLNF
jgi:outer membrane receptor protein involved in Fe transport